jgi:hypothetical protein
VPTSPKPFERFGCGEKAVKTARAWLSFGTRLNPGINEIKERVRHPDESQLRQPSAFAVAKNSS